MSAKQYSAEFKIEAVKKITGGTYKIGEVAKRLCMTTKSLHDRTIKFGDAGVSQHEIFNQPTGCAA